LVAGIEADVVVADLIVSAVAVGFAALFAVVLETDLAVVAVGPGSAGGAKEADVSAASTLSAFFAEGAVRIL
jgi:hypothetical protein